MNLNASTLGLAQAQRGLAIDAKSLNDLNALAGKDNRAALKETARQFEALFMKELLKSMREATMKSGLMDGEMADLGTDMLDQQWAVQMTGMPGGLAEMIERQLSQQLGSVTPPANGSAPPKADAVDGLPAPSPRSTVGGLGQPGVASASQVNFVNQHRASAQAVARESGIPASFMLGQAGHETGWGRGEIRHPDGSPAHNLFGIKAGPSWKGKVAEITTTEYTDGVPRKVTARFRAYDSYADSFRDYARLIGQSPRYQEVMGSLHSPVAFARELQEAGYATDPQYAAKLSRAINTTLSLQRAQA